MSIGRDEEKKKKPSILGAAQVIGKQPGSPAKRMDKAPAQTVKPGVQAKTPLTPTVNTGAVGKGRGKITSVKTVFDSPSIPTQPKIRTAAEMVADIYKIGQTDRAYSDQLMTMFEAERRNKASIYYNPYTAPTNTMALESLAELGVDVSQGIDDNFFQSYAWLKNNQRTGISGTPLAPTKSSSREENAAYYYNKLLEAEDTTRKAEAEWDELRQKAAYLSKRSDRNYSDEEIVKLLNIEKNYPTLAKLDRERAAGTPVQLNRGVGYSQDGIYGAIWAGRGNESSGDSFVDAVNAKLGRGVLYAPNNQIKKRLNPESQEYNPYLLGSTIDDEAALFGMSTFSKAWLDQNAGAIMANGTEDQQRAFQRIYDAEIRTKAAEDEIKDFFSKPEAKVRSIAKSALRQGMTADEAIREYMSGDYSTIGNLIDGLDRRQPVGITRKLDFDYHALLAQVDEAMAVEHTRQTDIAAAQEIEKSKALSVDGDATEDDLAPKSKTASRGGLGAFTQGTVTFLTDAGKAIGDLVGSADKPAPASAKKPDGPKAPAGYKSDNQSVINRIMTEAKEKGWKRIEDVPFGKRMIETIVKGNPYFDREMEQYFLMKDNEVEQYNYLFDKQGEAAANDYFRGLQKERLNKEYRAYWDNEAKKFAQENPVGASLATVANSFVGAAEGLTTLFDDLILGNEISKDDIRLSGTAANTTIRGTVSENINDPTWNFLYQSGMSIADSLSRMALGATGMAITMFGASSASTVDEMLSQGATREQALILGGISGVLETVMERAGMNRLTGMIKGVGGKGARQFFKGIVTQGVKNMVPELAEELVTEIGNTVADVLVRGEDSEPMQLHRYFQSEGMTSEQAWDAVAQTIGGNFAMAGAGGAFSGFVFGNIGNIAQSFNAKMNGAAAVQSFKALNEAGDVQNAGGQVLAAQVASQVVNSHSIDQMNDPKIKEELAPYNAKIAEAMGIGQALADSVAGKIVSKGSVKADKTLLAGVRALAQMPEKNQLRTIKAVTAKTLSLAEVQTLAKINMLKNASTSQNKSEQVDALVNDALVKATDQTVQALGVSGMPENTVKFAQERWGTEGVLYLGNLLQSENQTAQRIAVALQTMPTYAQAVIVAEENMKSVTLTPDAVAKQIEAFKADAQNPEIMDNASDRAISQAVEVKVSAVMAEAAPEVKAVERAAAKVNESQGLVTQAMAEGDAAAQALKAAAEQFLSTPEDKTAANAYTAAQAALKRSKDKLEAAKRVLAADDNILIEAEKTLKERQAQARAEAEAQATQEVLQSAQAAQMEQEAQAVQAAPLKQTNGQVIPDNFESYADEFVAENYADASDDVKTDIKQRFIDTTNKRLGRKPLDLNSPAYGEKNRNFMAQVEKKFGVSISLDANIADGTEAWFSPETNEIKINPNMTADNALIGVVMHELTHLAEESGWYDEYQDAALTLKYGDDYAGNANYQRDIDAKIKRYANASITLTPDQAIAEIVAEETRHTIFADDAAIKQFVEREPSLARRILAALNDIIQSMRQLVGGAGVTNETRIEHARVLLETALNERAERLSPDRVDTTSDLSQGLTMGKAGKTYTTDTDQRIDFHWALIDKNEIITSNNDDLSVNPNYPAEYQPKDRTRQLNVDQVERITRKGNPDRLGDAPEVTSGAPTIGKDRIVEVGNGRAIAIRKAMSQGNVFAIQYTQWLKENAGEFGLDPAAVTNDSILVRVRDTDVNRELFTSGGNVPPGMAYSASENAASDAKKLTPEMLAKVKTGSTGELDLSSNNAFITWFINNVIPENERNTITDSRGWLSKGGFERLRNTLFQRAYNDIDTTAQLAEQQDGVIKNAIGAMTIVAPRLAIINDKTAAGRLVENKLSQNILDAYKGLQTIRKTGIDAETFFIQESMDSSMPDFDEPTKALIRLFDKRKMNRKWIVETLESIMDVIEEQGDPAQTVNQGLEKPVLSYDRIVHEGIERYNNLREGVQQDLLSQIQYSLKDVDPKYLNYKENMDTVTGMETVAQLTGDEFSKGPIDLLTQVTKFFDSIGNEIKNPALGSVLLTESGIRSSIGHKMGRKKAIAFAAVPKIIENGQIIYAKENWKGREYDSAVIAAPIAISNERYYAGVVVRLLSDRNSYYVHEVLIEKGTSLPLKTGTPAQGDGVTSDKDHPSVVSLLQQVKDVKKEDAAIKSEKKYSLTNQEQDSDDAPLTPAQAEYFKDSKVRDEQGRLLKVYHGTGRTFNEFRLGTAPGWGKGIYLTDNRENASEYGDNVIEAYVDIRNPYIDAPGEFDTERFKNTEAYKKHATKWLQSSDMDTTGIEVDPYELWQEQPSFIYDVLTELGYDGIMVYESNNIDGYEIVAYKPEQVKRTDNFSPTSSRDIRYSLSDQDTEKINKAVDDLLRKFGAIPQGEKAKNTAEIPVKTSDELTARKHVRTVSEADILDIAGRNELNRKIVAEHFSYEPISDDEAMAYASGMDSGELERVWSRSIEGDAIPGKRQIAVGERLLVQYAEAGETDSAMRMIAELSEVLTRAGQTVQAARLLKKTTNAGALYYIQRAVKKLNEGIGGADIGLNPDLVDDLLNAKTGQERDAAIKAIQKDAGQQIPPNWKTRLNAWRYFAMLGNPRTHIRNIVGNAIFMPAVKIKNMIGAGIEAATGQDRTKSVVLDRGLRRAAMQDAEAHMEELMGGGKYNPAGEIEQFKRSFGDSSFGKGMEALTEFNSALLEKEDGIFLKRHYANALAGYLQANGMTLDDADETALTKARQYAVDEAKKATYRDASVFANWLNTKAQQGGLTGLIIEGIMPFKKTPANILKRGVEYSPIGLIDTLTRGVKQLKDKKITPTQFIDKISSGMTGTMIAGLGLFLNSLGLIRIGGGDDKEEEFERQAGAQNYSIEILGHSITLDWMTPASMPLFVGASLGRLMEEERNTAGIAEVLNSGFQALQGLMEPMFSLSMLSGIDQAIQSAALNQENAITAIMVNSSLNYAGQFVPTLLGQVARTVDPERRRIYTDKNIPLDSNIQRFIEQQQNKLPWLSTKNEPYIDVWGEAEQSGSAWLRALENFISPAYINELTPDAVEDLLLEVYRQTGDDRVLPASASKYFTVNGQRIDLDSKQYTDFSIARGKTMRSGLESMMADPRFAQADMQIKAGLIRDMVDYSTQIAKSKISDEFAMTGWMKEAKADPVDAIFKRVEEADYEAKRKNYRTSAMEAALTGDYDSLEAATGALMQAHINKNPDATDKQALSAAKRYLNDQAKAAYITAYQAEDEELMERIEDSFYDVGITFNYRDWLKDNE